MADPAAFPPAPWRLHPTAVISAWLVHTKAFPVQAAPGWRPFKLGSRAVMGAVWARYDPGGTLAYNEVAVGVLVRRGLRLGVCIGWIVVDDEAALQGGRMIWAVPKERASFSPLAGSPLRGQASAGETLGVEAEKRGIAWPLTISFDLAQPQGETARIARALVGGRFALSRARWRLPFAFASRRPLVSLVLADGLLTLAAPDLD